MEAKQEELVAMAEILQANNCDVRHRQFEPPSLWVPVATAADVDVDHGIRMRRWHGRIQKPKPRTPPRK